MKTISTFARILLGLLFLVLGLNGFLHFIPTLWPPGPASQFMGAMFVSRFYTVVYLTQIVGGLLLLANRYVPVGLLLLGPVLVNILAFHIFMAPAGLPIAAGASALWCIVFFRVRSAFAEVFVQNFD
jgi:putative oxidoreductase